MALVVGVHGIAQQFEGEETMGWLPALRGGLRRAGWEKQDLPGDDDLEVGFWGDLFRQPGSKSLGGAPLTASDVGPDGVDGQLLKEWWLAAAEVDDAVAGPDAGTKAGTPHFVQRALNQLSGSKTFAGVAERAFVGALRQVVTYFRDADRRLEIVERVASTVDDDTRVVVGHSLGSVVAYEALCAHPEWSVRQFVTVGSPLGIANVVFDRLNPAPTDGVGVWPGAVAGWTNIAEPGDVVALVKELSPLFGGEVVDELVDNGKRVHAITPYLTSVQAGRAIAAGLGDG